MKKSTNGILSDETPNEAIAPNRGYVQAFKLISMIDFVCKQYDYLTCDEASPKFVQKVIDYAYFLKQEIKLGMFIPCDENDVPLDDPKQVSPDGIKWNDYVELYQQAKERVIFHCIKAKKIPEWNCYMIYVVGTREKLFRYSIDRNLKENEEPKTIEDLVRYGLTVNLAACT